MSKPPTKELTHELMKMQFKVIGLNYDPEFCKTEKWYTTHSWTKEEKAEFKKQFTKRLREFGWALTRINQEFMWWDLAYGWKDAHSKAA